MSNPEASFILSSQERIDSLFREERDDDGTAETLINGTTDQMNGGERVIGPDGVEYIGLATQPGTAVEPTADQTDGHTFEPGRCGIGVCKFSWCQKCANLNVFVITYGIAGIWMTTLSSLLGSQITSIERHFGLSSSRTGMILSSNDIGYLIAVLIGSHLGKYTHIPRFLSISGVVFGIVTIAMSFGRWVPPKVWETTPVSGQLENQTNGQDSATDKYLCAIQHFPAIQSLHNTTNLTEGLAQSSLSGGQSQSFSPPWGLWLLVICAVLGGMAKSYRIPLLTHYVESNIIDKARSGFLLGTSFTAMVFGPPIAMFLGSYISSLPLDLKETSMSKLDQRWIGAWWLGFVIVGVASIVFSLPIMLFPRKMAKRKGQKTKPAQSSANRKAAFRKMLLDWPKSLSRTFRNPIFVLALISACIEGFAFSGYFAFSQKYLETQFNKTAQQVSMTSGIIIICSLAIGTFSGGFISMKLKLNLRGCAIMTLAIGTITLILDTLYLFIGCANSDIIGVNVASNLTVSSGCDCSEDNILMVCGDNNVDYRSPCLAGCTNATGMIFTNCTEISNGRAQPGLCELDCSFFIPYMVIYFIGALLGCASIVPGFMLTVRAVEHRDQALATGMASFCQTLLGMLPSPILFGKLIDSTCTLWDPSGAYCMLYDRETFRYMYQGLNSSLRLLSIAVTSCMLCLIHRRTRKKDSEGEQGSSEAST